MCYEVSAAAEAWSQGELCAREYLLALHPVMHAPKWLLTWLSVFRLTTRLESVQAPEEQRVAPHLWEGRRSANRSGHQWLAPWSGSFLQANPQSGIPAEYSCPVHYNRLGAAGGFPAALGTGQPVDVPHQPEGIRQPVRSCYRTLRF